MSATSENIRTEHMLLNFGPSHPATHGTLHLKMELDGETVVKIDPVIGYLHRGAEKLAENMTYHQWITISDRMNYVSSPMNNVGYCLAVEKLIGIEAPPRAQYLRVILSELSRLSDHLVCVGICGVDLGAFTPFLYAFQQRELIYDIFELACGGRLTTTLTRVGGVMKDVDEKFFDATKAICASVIPVINEFEALLTRNRIWIDRCRGVSAISAEEAINFGFTGPCLRAAGVDWDLRKNDPYLVYPELDFDIPIGENGDVYDRYLVRIEEMRQSVRIIQQAMARIPGGDVLLDNHRVTIPSKDEIYNTMEGLISDFKLVMHGIPAPAGEIYSATEAANGELGFYIVSNNGRHPYRLHVRPPCFIIFQALGRLCKGHLIADVIAVLGSLNIIAGELDR